MKSKNIVISAGGTGGHLFPAQALAEEIQERAPHIYPHFVSGGIKLLNSGKFPIHEVNSGTLSLRGLYGMTKGMVQSFSQLRALQPLCVVGFGSYHTFPTLVAAKLLRIPIILHEANMVPGKVNRYLSPYVSVTGLHFDGAKHHLKGKTEVVGMPTRRIYGEEIDPWSYFSLQPGKRTLLVFGGSQGAQGVNQLMAQAAPYLGNVQVIHATGTDETAAQLQSVYASHGISAFVTPFEKRMDLAWKASSLAITRSGASTIAEQFAFGVPAILIPYPHATDAHQEKNGTFMQDAVGGAEMYLQESLNGEKLASIIANCDIDRMKNAMKHYTQQHQTQSLCDLVLQQIGIS